MRRPAATQDPPSCSPSLWLSRPHGIAVSVALSASRWSLLKPLSSPSKRLRSSRSATRASSSRRAARSSARATLKRSASSTARWRASWTCEFGGGGRGVGSWCVGLSRGGQERVAGALRPCRAQRNACARAYSLGVRPPSGGAAGPPRAAGKRRRFLLLLHRCSPPLPLIAWWAGGLRSTHAASGSRLISTGTSRQQKRCLLWPTFFLRRTEIYSKYQRCGAVWCGAASNSRRSSRGDRGDQGGRSRRAHTPVLRRGLSRRLSAWCETQS